MKVKIKNIFKYDFVRNVLILTTGTAFAQVIGMVLAPVITRLYGPEAVGVMGVFTSIFQILIPVAAFTYPMSIVLPEKDENAKGIMKLSIYLSILSAVIMSLVIFIWNGNIARLFNINDYKGYLYFIPFTLLFLTFMQIFEQWFIRIKQFSINAKSLFYQSLINHGGKAGIGFLLPVAPVLIIISSLNHGLRALFLVINGRKSFDNREIKSEEPVYNVKEVAKKYFDFPTLRFPQMLIDALTKSLPILMLTSLFGKASAGYFTITNTVLTMPTSLIGKSIGNVFYPRINEAAISKENLTKLLKKAMLSLGAIGVLPFGLLVLFGPWLFGFVFGSDWSVAGEYARWLALSRFFRFVNEPCLRSFPVLSAQGIHLFMTISQTILRVLSLIVGAIIFGSDLIAVALYGITGMLINLLLILITLNISRKFDESNLDNS